MGASEIPEKNASPCGLKVYEPVTLGYFDNFNLNFMKI